MSHAIPDPRRTRAGDDGMTLIEVIIYIIVAGIALTLLGSVFLTGMRVDADTRDRDVATGTAQVITNSITMSLRNASEVEVDGPVLRARVAVGLDDWKCRAWYFDGDALRYVSYDTSDPVPAPSGEWKALGEGVRSVTPGVPFAQAGKSIGYAMTVTNEDAEVPIAGTAVARAVQDTSAIPEGTLPTCW